MDDDHQDNGRDDRQPVTHPPDTLELANAPPRHQSSEAKSDPQPLFSPSEWERLLGTFQLPPRQAQIVQLIVQGYSDAEIAEQLGIQLSTVRAHLGRVFQRCGTSDRTSLVIHLFRRFRTLPEGEQQ